jgi:hypothetical protein
MSNAKDMPAGIPAITAIDPAQWQPSERPLLFHFANFARMANTVELDGPRRGWFAEPLWRQYSYAPFNARVMENYFSLAFFAGHAAPWNIYHKHPGVLERLHAALEYTFALQDERGALPEYAPASVDTPMLAPSSFGAEYLALTLELAGDLLPASLRERLANSARAAARFVLTAEESWDHARSYSNQFLAAMTAALKVERVVGESGLRPLVERGLDALLDDFAAAPGYLYEADGADTFGYFFVSLSRLTALFEEYNDPRILEALRRHGAWMSRWMLPEPDGTTIICAGSHQTRTAGREWLTLDTAAQQHNLAMRAADGSWPWQQHGIGALLAGDDDERRFLKLFFANREALDGWHNSWTSGDLPGRCRTVGEYQPISTLYALPVYAAPAAEQAAARNALPCLHDAPGCTVEADAKGNQYAIVRRAAYSMGFAFAPNRSQATLGPAFLWNAGAGTLVLARNGGRAAWETIVGDTGTGRLLASASVRDEGATVEVLAKYPEIGVQKMFVLREHAIDVLLGPDAPQGHALREHVPLLLHDSDILQLDYGRCPVAGIYESVNGLQAVSQQLVVERGGQPVLRFDFHAPVTLRLLRRDAHAVGSISQVHGAHDAPLSADSTRYALVELRFAPAAAFYSRTGYRITVVH